MKKSALILLVAVAISTVSCVDNAVSPQVEAIRSQQVEWMKAKTAHQVAQTAMETAAAAYTAASNALLLKDREADYARKVAENADLLILAKYRMATAKAEFDAALVAISDAMALAGDAKGTAYLAKYTSESDKLVDAIANRLEIQNNLVSAELLVAEHPADLASYLVGYQADIDAQKAKIVGYNAAIAIYQGIEDGRNVTSYEKEKETLLLNNRTMLIRDIKLLYNGSKNVSEKNELLGEGASIETTRDDAVITRDDKITERDDLDDTNVAGANDEDIATLNTEIAALNVTIGKLNTKIAAIEASIEKLDDANAAIQDELMANSALTSKNLSIISALSDVISELNGTSGSLANGYNSIEQLIQIEKNNISDANTVIGELVDASEATSKEDAFTDAKAFIVVYTQQLATANVNVTAQEKIVAYWKALLDKIFTA